MAQIMRALLCKKVGYYTITAPKNIRAHSEYRAWVTLHNPTTATTIKLSIEDSRNYKNEKEITADNEQPQMVVFQLDDIQRNGSYKLVARGLSGIIFEDESPLLVEKKNVSLFIQTDKAIYKPGEKIRFRVLVLDRFLRPAAIQKRDLVVYISDGENNRIKQWRAVNLIKGVFSADLQLTEFPLLGDWKITAQVDDEEKIKSIEVCEYVLAKFDVTIDCPSHFLAKNGKICAIIRSKYTYGKPVKGDAVVSLSLMNRWYDRQLENGTPIVKKIKINGKGTIEFDVEDDIKAHAERFKNSFYDLKATVVEELSGLSASATKDITLHRTQYKFQTVDKESIFELGLPVAFTLVIKYHDDSLVPINENTKEVTIIKTDRELDNGTETYHKFDFSANGMIVINIPTSNRKGERFDLEVKFDDESYNIGWFRADDSQFEETDFGVKLLKTAVLGEPILAQVESKKPLQSFTYQLIAQGKIIRAETISGPNCANHVIEFPATFEMAPAAQLLVYYLDGDEIQSAHTVIELREDLSNFIDVKLASPRAQPGSAFDIEVSTNPNSYVGLLGVDQRVLLLKENSDLNATDAFDEIERYQTETIDNISDSNAHTYRNDYWDDFNSCRIILLTNSRKDKCEEFEYTSGLSMQEFCCCLAAGSLNKGYLPPKVRTEFPETWLWHSITDDDFTGRRTIQTIVPDSITSWVITGFSIDPVTGLGLTKQPKLLEVFQPFFVSLNLPYSVKRGEILTVPVIVFNYLESDAITEVTLHNEHDEFEFVDDHGSDKGTRQREITVPSNDGASTSFVIRPTKVGPISIKVVATSALAGDAVVVVLRVEAEGVPQFVNKALFVDLRDVRSLESSLTAEIPENAVADSAKLQVSVVGDLLGGTIKNLQSLIRLPWGCGEQNMLNFVPNIVILNYLTATSQLKPDIETRVKEFTESGYQRQLQYRHDNGSFSEFGKADDSGSTWLTAFVAKSFRQAADHIDIEESVITKALKWLSEQQSPNGSFPEVGKVSYKDMQGGSGNGVALTAYVLTSFLENMSIVPLYQETIDKAIENIVRNLDGVDDVYGLALASYALQLANHTAKSSVWQKFEAKATAMDALKWWRKSVPSSSSSQDTKTINIEITAYGLLTLSNANKSTEAFPYFKWLLTQRNEHGGFEGTQDTVVGLHALAKIAERISPKENNIQIVVLARGADETRLSVNKENALTFQSVELPSAVRSIDVNATGTGFALLQLSYSYNLDTVGESPAFTLKSNFVETQNEAQLKLEVVSSYNAKEGDGKESNMALLEVSLPSGYTTGKEFFADLLETAGVKKVETKNGDTVVVIYFGSLSEKEVRVTIIGFQRHKVEEPKPASIVLYDYYDSSRIAFNFYSVPHDV